LVTFLTNIPQKEGNEVWKDWIFKYHTQGQGRTQEQKVEGTFLEYLEIVKENPEITMLAHQRMYKLITEPGVTVIRTEENPRLRRIYGNDIIKKYKFLRMNFSE